MVDISHFAMPTVVATEWGQKIADEFHAVEKHEFKTEQDKTEVTCRMHIKYIKDIVKPSWQLFMDVLPFVGKLYVNVDVNMDYYYNKLAETKKSSKDEETVCSE